MADTGTDYAFPHGAANEARRLDLLQERLDPLTIRRVERLSLVPNARCLEVGGGRGSIARWLCERVGPNGRVTATDLDTRFLSLIDSANLEVLRHDVRTDHFAEASFDLIHARTVLMHLGGRLSILKRMATWLAPGGWLLIEDADFGMWMSDYDPLWAAYPRAWHEAFPNASLSQGRALLKHIHQLGLQDVGADAEVDIVEPGTPVAEFYRLSVAATAAAAIAAGALTPQECDDLTRRMERPDFLASGFVHIGAWGRRPQTSCTGRQSAQG
jgi:SAM-dependent methyltransferase